MPDPLLALLVGMLILAVILLLFGPGIGLISRWQRMQHMSDRVLREDALKHLHKAAIKGFHPNLQSLAGELQISLNHVAELITDMERQGLVTLEQGELRLTHLGRKYSLHIIRAHRLWERYLAEETGYGEMEWHDQADRQEHLLSPEQANILSVRLGNPTHDPHGDPIPTATGEIKPHGGCPLTALGLEQAGRIVHIEDEPDVVYAQILAEGLYPGLEVRVIESVPQRIRFWADNDEHLLAPLVAANISVIPCSPDELDERPGIESLDSLKPGQVGSVLNISPRCRGPERRRLMDLGIIPGTQIQAEMRSPSGDPIAYRIRGALIALRKEQAEYIQIVRGDEVIT